MKEISILNDNILIFMFQYSNICCLLLLLLLLLSGASPFGWLKWCWWHWWWWWWWRWWYRVEFPFQPAYAARSLPGQHTQLSYRMAPQTVWGGGGIGIGMAPNTFSSSFGCVLFCVEWICLNVKSRVVKRKIYFIYTNLLIF